MYWSVMLPYASLLKCEVVNICWILKSCYYKTSGLNLLIKARSEYKNLTVCFWVGENLAVLTRTAGHRQCRKCNILISHCVVKHNTNKKFANGKLISQFGEFLEETSPASHCMAYCLTYYLSIYLSIYLSNYIWLYRPLLGLGRFFSLLIFYIVGRTHWTGISRSKGCYLHKHRINTHRYPCLEWNSNPRSQRPSGWREFMP
jgi:hypothetical protein